MCLFLKEQVGSDRVRQCVRRVEEDAGVAADGGEGADTAKSDPEECLLRWADACCRALAKRAQKESAEVRFLNIFFVFLLNFFRVKQRRSEISNKLIIGFLGNFGGKTSFGTLNISHTSLILFPLN